MSFIDSLPEQEELSINVSIRVRPMNKKERKKKSKNIIQIDNSTIQITANELGRKSFTYDNVFSPDQEQEQIYNAIGKSVINNSYQGYNSCIFAYGQTGSGKTYTMLGDKHNTGLIPRICDELFAQQETHNDIPIGNCLVSYQLEMSYLEIYSETIEDLLSDKTNLRIREHPELGPYIEGLTRIPVEDYHTIKKNLYLGNKKRHIAATKMNKKSSRSHAILIIYFTQIIDEPEIERSREIVSQINLIDLAGSEKIELSGVKGVQLREAIKINKSLSALSLVIDKLAKKKKHIPYRDSTLTWLLKESLGGNSKTFMIANISPSDLYPNETLQTLRYASNAKQVKLVAKINEDSNDKIIRILKDEIKALRMKLRRQSSIVTVNSTDEVKKLQEEIQQRELLMKEKEKTWEDRLAEQKHKQTDMLHQQQIFLNKIKKLADQVEKYKQLIDQQTNTHEKTISSLKQKHQSETNNIIKQHNAIIKQLKTAHKIELASQLDNQLDNRTNNDELTKKITQLTKQLNKQNIQHAKQIQQLNAKILMLEDELE